MNRKKGELRDEYGQPIDEFGRALDENGNPYDDEVEQTTGSFEVVPPQQQQRTVYAAQNHTGGKKKKRGFSMPEVPSVPKMKKKKKKHGILKTILTLILIVGIAAAADLYYLMTLYTYDNTNESSISATDGVMNVGLFGVDADDGTGIRSDAMMLMSVDSHRNKIKLVSLMRDSYVEVPGYGKTKLTHAYSYGGPQLTMQTINQAFDMDVNEYITVNFEQMESIIEAVGGVTINVEESELEELNRVISDYARDTGKSIPAVEYAGEQKLDGAQSVCYGRIRYNTGGDWGRTERQSKLLSALFSSVRKNPVKLVRFMHGLMPNITSSLSKRDFVKLGIRAVMRGIPGMEHTRLPLDGEWNYGEVSGMSIITFSDSVLADHLHKYLYEDIFPGEG